MNTRFRTRTLLSVAVGALLASSTVSAGFKRFEQQLRGGEPSGQREPSGGQREPSRGQREQSRGQPEQSRGQPGQSRGQPPQSRNRGEAPRGQDRPAPPAREPGGRQHDPRQNGSHQDASRAGASGQYASRPPQPRDDTMRRGTPGRGAPAPRLDASQPRDAGNDHSRDDHSRNDHSRDSTPPRFDGKVGGRDQPGRSWNGGSDWQGGGSRPVYRPGVAHRPAPRFVTSLPHGHRSYNWNGASYYHYGSHWYRPYGTRYVVVGAPYGLFVSYLPSYYSSLWYGGVHYYHADSTWYVYEPVRRGYVVTRSPYDDGEDEEQYTSTADEDLYVYPAQGQSEQQQADDRFECHRWAVDETDYDPIDADYDADRRAEYTRALTACLTGRGYSVR